MTKNTQEKDRGNPFVRCVKMWRILQRSARHAHSLGKLRKHGQVLNKHRLAQLFFNTQTTTETQKRNVQRLVESLVKVGVALRCDNNGKELSQKELNRIIKKNPSEERFWKYNANCEWIRELANP